MTTLLLLHPDRFLAQALSGLAREASDCEVLAVSTFAAAQERLASGDVTVLVASLDPLLGDVTELFAHRLTPTVGLPPLRVLLLCAEEAVGDWLLVLARDLSLNVCDPTQDTGDDFRTALHATRDGTRYWSPSLHARILRLAQATPRRGLTRREQLIFSILGDGCDDRSAAQLLGLQPTSVATVRRELHRKLKLQHRGELIRTAALQGFVRFTASGVVRPGFALLQSLTRLPRRPGTTASRLVA